MIAILKLDKPNITDYASERNELLKKSKNEWDLFLDSDETIAINKIKPEDKYDSYYLPRKNYFIGQFVGTDKIIRLVKKNTGKFVRKVHEVWLPNNKSMVGNLEVEIIHNTANELSVYLNKINKYSDLHAVENMKEGKKSTILKIIFYPIAKFIFTFIKSRHVVFSVMQSLHSFLSWTKLYFLQNG